MQSQSTSSSKLARCPVSRGLLTANFGWVVRSPPSGCTDLPQNDSNTQTHREQEETGIQVNAHSTFHPSRTDQIYGSSDNDRTPPDRGPCSATRKGRSGCYVTGVRYHLSLYHLRLLCHPIYYHDVHVKRQSRSADAVILVDMLMLPHRVCGLERLKLVR